MRRALFLFLILGLSSFGQTADPNAYTAPLSAASATCTAAGSCLAFDPRGTAQYAYTAVGIQITGTWAATIQFEGTIDCSTWFAVQSADASTGANATSTTANGQWVANVSGFCSFRARVSDYTSGTATVTLRPAVQSYLPVNNPNVTGNLTIGTTVPQTFGDVGARTQDAVTSTLDASGYGGAGVPRYVRSQHIVFQEFGNVTANWTVTNGTKALDSTVANCPASPTYTCVAVTGANAQSTVTATRTLTTTTNFSGKHFAFTYYIPTVATVTALHLRFYSTADYYDEKIWDNTDTVANYTGNHQYTGAAGTNTWTASGSPSWSTITSIAIVATTDSTTSAVFNLGTLTAFTPPNAKGIVIVGMDGAWAGQDKAVAYANARGIPVTLFVSPTLVGQAGRLTLTQVQDIKRYGPNGGNLVALYLYGLSTNWQSLTDAQRSRVIRLGALWGRENGFGDGSRICSPPGTGVRSQLIMRTMLGGMCDIPPVFNQSESHVNTLWDARSIYMTVSPGGNAAALASALADAVSSKTIYTSIWHDPYNNDGNSQAIWESHMDAIKAAIDAGSVEAVTPLDIQMGRITLSDPSAFIPSGATGVWDFTNQVAGTTAIYSAASGGEYLTGSIGTIGASGVTFDGSTQYLNMTPNPLISAGSTGMTVAAIVSASALANNPSRMLYQNWGGSGFQTAFYVNTTGTVGLQLGFSDASTSTVTSAGTVTTGNYYLLVGTYDGVALRLYISGVVDGNTTAAASKLMGTPTTPNRIAPSFAGTYSWLGTWNRALTAAEVTTMYGGLRLAMAAKVTPVVVQ